MYSEGDIVDCYMIRVFSTIFGGEADDTGIRWVFREFDAASKHRNDLSQMIREYALPFEVRIGKIYPDPLNDKTMIIEEYNRVSYGIRVAHPERFLHDVRKGKLRWDGIIHESMTMELIAEHLEVLTNEERTARFKSDGDTIS